MPEEPRPRSAVGIAQEGRQHAAAKQMKGLLREVNEVVALCDDGTYRLMYTARLGEVIYVRSSRCLRCFRR
jgi:phage-related protein